ncbi:MULTISPECIES: preATP grasp domain-containing protein [unclassified Streptomyces]|uniref:preATP grasp domain-containing protein n=1 Tax=unclassified Streptomyces TaxID=2593676 RepID=UPI001F53E69B|nr:MULTISPECIES: ATP-grasp domain-containing protein [unclassified Streptomyces]
MLAPPDPPFMARLRSGVADGHALVLMGNFEVEDRWARNEIGLPRLSFGSASPVVNRMDELALLLAGPGDRVLMKEAPDPDHLQHLTELGFALPRVVTPAQQNPAATVTDDALRDPALLAELARLGDLGFRLLPHGTSEGEERLATTGGIPLAAPPAAVCKEVNSKVYSRRLAKRTGLRQPLGWACSDLAELDAAVDRASALLREGRTVVLKDAYGVSGKGIAVVEDPARLERLHRKVTALARKRPDARLGLVIEEWVAKKADYNYQLTVRRDGSAHFDGVKRALTRDGVHKGHLIPSGLTAGQLDEVRAAARTIGRELAADGWFGVVGVDAMTGQDDTLYPVVEINARNNMATYLSSVQDRILPGGSAGLVREYPLTLGRPLAYKNLRDALGDLAWTPGNGSGLLVNAFATVNAARDTPRASFDGRLYGVVVAPDDRTLHQLDERIAHRLDLIARETQS